jgi:hypothetical protein
MKTTQLQLQLLGAELHALEVLVCLNCSAIVQSKHMIVFYIEKFPLTRIHLIKLMSI